MKNRFKVSIWFIVTLAISFLVSTGSVLAKDVRVDRIPHSVGQCYQFIAENQPASCPKNSSIWLVKIIGANCNVKVWADYGGNTLTCDTVKKGGNLITGKKLHDLQVKGKGPDGKTKTLSNAITADTKCDDVWLRFTDDVTKCNLRCYISGGRAYCR